MFRHRRQKTEDGGPGEDLKFISRERGGERREEEGEEGGERRRGGGYTREVKSVKMELEIDHGAVQFLKL